MLASDLLYIVDLIARVDRGEIALVRQMSFTEKGYWYINCPACEHEGVIKCDGFVAGVCKHCRASFEMLLALTLEHAVISRYPKMIFFLKRLHCVSFAGTTASERLKMKRKIRDQDSSSFAMA